MSKEMLIFVSIPYFLMVAYFLKGRTLTIFVPQFYNQLIISHSYTLHRNDGMKRKAKKEQI